MAVLLEANYSKKLGLPEFSSHSYSVSVRSELQDLTQLKEESARLYHLLQDSVDDKIKDAGFHPLLNRQKVAESKAPQPSNRIEDKNTSKRWVCSDKQKKFICDLIAEHNIPDEDIDELSCSMFQKNVFELTKFEASGLISELFNQHGKPSRGK